MEIANGIGIAVGGNVEDAAPIMRLAGLSPKQIDSAIMQQMLAKKRG